MLSMKSLKAGGLATFLLFSSIPLSLQGIRGAESGLPLQMAEIMEGLVGLPDVPRPIAESMQDKRYDEAVRLIDEELGKKSSQSDYLLYLKGRALYLQQKYDRAVEVLQQAEKDFPQSSWRSWFRFGQALALARKGDFAAAEAIYREEAQRILSPERSKELVAIYLEFADRYFQPVNVVEEKPDYNKAREFYTKALEMNPEPATRARIAFQIARCSQLASDWGEAVRAYQEFLRDFPGDSREVQARLFLGEALLAAGNAKEARRVWEDLLSQFGDRPNEEVATAAFFLARTRGMPEPTTDEDLSQGVAYLRQFLERFPKDRRVPAAYLQMAQGYVHLARWHEAEEVLREFLQDPRAEGTPERAEALFLLGEVCLGQEQFAKAIEAWRVFVEQFPTHARWSEAQSAIINTEYEEAMTLFQEEKYGEAEGAVRNFVTRHPLDGRVPEILFKLGSIALEQKNYEEAIRRWQQLAEKYPQNSFGQQAVYEIGRVYEEKLLDAEKALEFYRKVTGPFGPLASSAIARLTARSLLVETLRIYRSDETPKIRLVTRNLEKVTISVYSLDLEAYFRKYGTLRGVEGLDLALIDPDERREITIPDYKPHTELETFVSVPLPGGKQTGAAVVTVSSPTLEATTLVLQSDLDIVVKSSRDQLFLFAENMQKGAPWPGVRVFIVDNEGRVHEGKTDDQGVYLLRLPGKLRESIGVLAVADGHCASNALELSGIAPSRGLTDRGLIYTDRPIYRPGQVVNVRCIIRLAEVQKREGQPATNRESPDDGNSSLLGPADRLVAPAGRKFRLQVLDPAQRSLRGREIVLDSYGCFHDQFLLPDDVALGEYRIIADDGEGHLFQGTFRVASFELAPVQVIVDTPRQVYYRGERIEGTIRVAFNFGGPVVGEEVRYQLDGERVSTAITDEKGEVRFSLDTRDFPEAQILPFTVMLPRRNLKTAVNFVLAVQGFSIRLTTSREVYLPGESFEVLVETHDAAGQPVSEKLILKALRRARRGRIQGTTTVSEMPLKTDAQGIARLVLRLEEGGDYLLRAEGTDRFGHPIWEEVPVKVSDEKDADRLFILSDQHTFRVGDVAQLRIHWKEAPALAVVCFQGAEILGYRIVSLKRGENELHVPIAAEMAPEFAVSVCAMRDIRDDEALVWKRTAEPEDVSERTVPPRRFFEATSGFKVERELQVKLEWRVKGQPEEQSAPQPGGELEVTVITTDAQGRPVAAQVSLALVESSLVERFGVGPRLADWFRGETRQGQFATVSSIEFSYRPLTQPINRVLLAEEERERLKADEAATRQMFDAASGLGGYLGGEARLSKAFFGPRGEALGPADRERAENQLREGAADKRTEKRGKALLSPPGPASPWSGVSPELEQLALDNKREVKAIQAGEYKLAPWREEKAAGLARLFLPTQDSLRTAAADPTQKFLILDSQGRLQVLNVSQLRQGNLVELAEQLNNQGALLYLLTSPAETAFWDPAVDTGPEGKATLTIPLPDRATTWRLIAKGVTGETLVGETDVTISIKKDFFAEVKWPGALRLGDSAEIPVVLHNDRFDSADLEVRLTRVIGGRRVTDSQQVKLTGKGPFTLAFPVVGELPGDWTEKLKAVEDPQQLEELLRQHIEFTLAVVARDTGEVLDSVSQTIPLRPQGVWEFVTTGGSATGDTTAWLELPAKEGSSPWLLEILIGPSVERSLLDIVFAWPYQIEMGRMYLICMEAVSPAERLASDLMAAVAIQDYLARVAPQETSLITALEARIRESIGGLVASQQEDGGWVWRGRPETVEGRKKKVPSNPWTSARVCWALALARSAGHPVPEAVMDNAIAYLEKIITEAPAGDNEIRAVLVHTLARVGRADFALLNRLHRERQTLSLAGKLYLALALAATDRKGMAEDVLQLIDLGVLEKGSTPERMGLGVLAPDEAHALYALALSAISPDSPEWPREVEWLMEHRVGSRWIPDRATGPAALALAQWFGRQTFQTESYQLSVLVNDFQVASFLFDARSPTQSLLVPIKFLKEGKQRIQFRVDGRGRYTYQCVAGHFVTTVQPLAVPHRYLLRAVPLEVDGREVPVGTAAVIPKPGWSSPVNTVSQLPVGKQALVSVDIFPRWDQQGDQLSQMIISVPIPAGTGVVPQSVQGVYDHYEVREGEIVFYVLRRDGINAVPLSFRIVGLVPGKYDLHAVIIRDATDPRRYVVIPPTHGVSTLEVLPAGSSTKDTYVLSPQELYELGKIAFRKQKWQEAERYFGELLKSNDWRVQDEVLKELAPMMIDISLELDKPAEVVQYFEILKVKWPDFEIPFDKILKIATCYERLGEYERSFLIFRAILESRFVSDSNVAGFLDDQGAFVSSVAVMNRLLAEYPPEAYAAAARYALAQRIYAKAQEEDQELRKLRINRIHLVSFACGMLDRFLTAFPEDPGADQAAFAAANALLEAQFYDRAAAAAARYAERYPQSPLVDSFWYMVGYCHFALGKHQEAVEMCQKVAQTQRTDPATGRTVESPNKWQALYILGQIYHSLGNPKEAVQYYGLVADRFSDAKEAIDYFTRKSLELPEVTTVPPGTPVVVPLTFRNLASCEVRAYRVDLFKFALLKRDLTAITAINLAGIQPEYEETVTLGDGRDYRDRKHELKLPFQKEGAYLVVCRSESLYASGMVVVSPLVMEVQEDAMSGRVRVTIKDTADHFVKGVKVRVIGQRNEDFVSGETDLRGVFVADGIRGRVTVIARQGDDKYAFYRGQLDLLPELPAKQPPPPRARVPGVSGEAAKPGVAPRRPEEDLLRGLQESNQLLQQQQIENLRRIYRQQRKGVEASQAF